MSPDPDYDLVSDQKLSRQMMPRIAVPDHERWLAGGMAATEGSTSPQSATPATTLPFAGVVTASAAEPPLGIEQPRRFPANSPPPGRAPGRWKLRVVIMSRSPPASDSTALLTRAMLDLVHR
jgi:hypothetical protein